MPTFNSNPTVFTRSHGGQKDATPASLGKLSSKGMTSATGMSGTNGVETAVITGPRFQRLTGKETIFRIGDVLDNTKGDWTDMLDGSEDATITKNYTLLVKGDVSETTKGATKQTFTGPTANLFKSEKLADEPLEWFHHVKEVFSYGIFHSDTFFAYSLTGVLGLSGFVANTDLRGVNVGFLAAKGEICPHEFWVKEEKLDLIMMHQRVSVTETFVMAVEPGVGAAMMHEVAVTQEIFALGANQAF